MNNKDIYNELLNIKTILQVENFIKKYGGIWNWKPVGGRENAGVIEMGSEPGDALAERITKGNIMKLASQTQCPYLLEKPLKIGLIYPKDN
ncbi:hypothetical protein HYW99_02290 [Candidatus Woesearchaeota archaeon]|nr:hypothetical protein [Candidatus Woesearchaeota archaeon]